MNWSWNRGTVLIPYNANWSFLFKYHPLNFHRIVSKIDLYVETLCYSWWTASYKQNASFLSDNTFQYFYCNTPIWIWINLNCNGDIPIKKAISDRSTMSISGLMQVIKNVIFTSGEKQNFVCYCVQTKNMEMFVLLSMF